MQCTYIHFNNKSNISSSNRTKKRGVCSQVTYESVGPVQMGFLRILSSRASQNVTFSCVNSVVWEEARTRSFAKAVRLLGDNEKEWTAQDRLNRPTVIVDRCKVCILCIISLEFPALSLLKMISTIIQNSV